MKYKKCLYLLIIFVMVVLLIVFFYNQSQNIKPEVRNINDLKVVSSNGEYILVDSQEPNSSTFSVYKKIEYGNYGPTFENIEVIAKVLNVKPYLLFQENSNTHKKLPNRVDMKRF